MLFVFILLFISMIVMILHILLEGFVSNFNVAEIPNSEISYTVDGVSRLMPDTQCSIMYTCSQVI